MANEYGYTIDEVMALTIRQLTILVWELNNIRATGEEQQGYSGKEAAKLARSMFPSDKERKK